MYFSDYIPAEAAEDPEEEQDVTEAEHPAEEVEEEAQSLASRMKKRKAT
jgi:hypothetical protein